MILHEFCLKNVIFGTTLIILASHFEFRQQVEWARHGRERLQLQRRRGDGDPEPISQRDPSRFLHHIHQNHVHLDCLESLSRT